MLWIIRDNNTDATKYYLDILEESAKILNEEVKQVDDVNLARLGSKDDIYLVTTLLDAIKILKMGKKRIFIWFQGAFSEESYMKHNSKVRKYLLGKIEKIILKKAEFIFFVSEEMKKYYTDTFKVNIDDKYYVMPCFNSNIIKESFYNSSKYKENVFCYAGSLSIWQGFETILKYYKKVEDLGIQGTKLLILTREKEKALKLINEIGIKNYCIDYKNLDELYTALSQAKFGFIIREENIVNRVSTPTKISTYMANGIIPIYSECLVDFHEYAKRMKYAIKFDKYSFIDDIKGFMNKELDSDDIYYEFSNIFDYYFNGIYHANQIANKTNHIYKRNI